MKTPLHLLVTLLFSLVLLIPSALAKDNWYVGSEKCMECHLEQFNDWQASGHPYKLRKAEKARYTGIPLPKGYLWDDISYVIGGVSKKALYIDTKGYIITRDKDGKPAPTQYNLASGSWSDYYPGEKKAYHCGSCHTTGYKKEGRQDGQPGMIGTWAEDGVGCEACHGPGSTHAFAKKPSKNSIIRDTESERCGTCHQRNRRNIPPLAVEGFIAHHQQFNELSAGGHDGTDCVECHNPHKKAITIKAQCVDCHGFSEFKTHATKSTHGKAGIECVDCHMPKAAMSAEKRRKHVGDVRSHLVKINLNPKTSMFKVGKLAGQKLVFTKGFITLDFACLSCHGSRDMGWAARNAKNYHDKY